MLGQALLRRLMDSCEKRKRERALITGGNTLGLPETQFKFEEPNIEMCKQQRKIDPCNYSIPLPLIHAETATIFSLPPSCRWHPPITKKPGGSDIRPNSV